MKQTITLLLLCFSIAISAQSKSRIIKIDNFRSKYVNARNVEIWLPPGYDDNNNKEMYPVLYMHDGQNVFDKGSSGFGVAWEADSIANKLITEGRVKPFIIVTAAHGNNLRYMEYFPEQAAKQYFTEDDMVVFKDLAKQMNVKVNWLADEYLQFLVKELKPYIDKNYRTLRNNANTSVCGSSMGGLISMYAICEYPEVFGQAACVSTHWPLLFDNNNMKPSEAVRSYMKDHFPSPKDHRVYFDYGTATLDQYYEPHQKLVDDIMRAKGYTEGRNWVTRKFEGAEHNEQSWQNRMDVILEFLYGK
ncbi:alpha/beta hydrolase-fold protein [Flavobacterium sp. MFBS3-15]|uniref:alpha/beta hydrolase n=1 Tax=Flavobacterium sp. MFBS3-15 TaxID=2989816 RepID=UPI002235587C|nr:alpha/beta hydrolase-fold protein [Flavobacterium sp. MFBS3-15]MCW4469925.1 alpha/beta hydrolase-fold protein [Flavobacterium sp. MFBS3-15]